MITYGDLFRHLQTFTDEQLNLTASVYVSDIDETFAIRNMRNVQDNDTDPVAGVLDNGHPIMITLTGELTSESN